MLIFYKSQYANLLEISIRQSNNNQIYEQIDGVSMGSPIAPCMADTCMNWVLNQALNNANLH